MSEATKYMTGQEAAETRDLLKEADAERVAEYRNSFEADAMGFDGQEGIDGD